MLLTVLLEYVSDNYIIWSARIYTHYFSNDFRQLFCSKLFQQDWRAPTHYYLHIIIYTWHIALVALLVAKKHVALYCILASYVLKLCMWLDLWSQRSCAFSIPVFYYKFMICIAKSILCKVSVPAWKYFESHCPINKSQDQFVHKVLGNKLQVLAY